MDRLGLALAPPAGSWGFRDPPHMVTQVGAADNRPCLPRPAWFGQSTQSLVVLARGLLEPRCPFPHPHLLSHL